MMYNPYNWKINKENEEPKPAMTYECVLNELGYVCTELDIKKIEHEKLLKDLEDLKIKIDKINKDIVGLEEKRVYLINDLSSHP